MLTTTTARPRVRLSVPGTRVLSSPLHRLISSPPHAAGFGGRVALRDPDQAPESLLIPYGLPANTHFSNRSRGNSNPRPLDITSLLAHLCTTQACLARPARSGCDQQIICYQPIQSHGGGPRLIVCAEQLAGEGVEVLAKAVECELLEGCLPQPLGALRFAGPEQ
jgi:hypothetical protein